MRPPRKFSRPLATIALFLATTNALAQTPAIGTIAPAQATVNAGVSQTLVFTASYAPGAQPDLNVQITAGGNAGCWFQASWNVGTPSLILRDGNTGSIAGTVNFGAGTVSSSFCQIGGQSFLFDAQGNATVTVNVTFPTAMAGQTLLYNECATDDATNDNSGWWGMYGYYLLIGAANQGPPTLGTVTPANGGTAPYQPFTLQITAIDPNGWTYGNLVRILISPNHDSLNACLITIIPAQGVMYLDNNDLTDWTTVLPAVNQMNWPAQGFASNSQCTLTGQGSPCPTTARPSPLARL